MKPWPEHGQRMAGCWSGAFEVPRKKPYAKRNPYLQYGKKDDAQRLDRADEFERVKAFVKKFGNCSGYTSGNMPIHDIEEGETFKSLKSWLAYIKRENARAWPGSYEEGRWAVIIDAHN